MRKKRRTSHQIQFALLLFALAACTPQPPATESIVTPSVVTPTVVTTDWFQVYFTNPADLMAEDYAGGPDEALADAIHAARLSLDVAVYSLNLWSIRDALLDAWHRGVVVRMVMESDNMDSDEAQALIAAGIPILGDRREGLMHDKFVVIDRQEVWTGSMNFTTGGAYKDNNNLIRIRSTEVAQDYTQEFNEMFVEDKFGPNVVADTPYPSLTIGDTSLEIYFSPDDGVAARLVTLIQSAQESINFMAYSFTSNDIGAAVLERAAAGVTVAGVMDAGQVVSNQGSEYDPFLQAGLDIRLDGNPGLMHHKVIIIDGSIVITGSYNFSASAEEVNDENLILIYSPDIAAQYLAEFMRIYAQAQP
ncbi:MAG: phospholipase D-like domain-containing protein [Anaerolineales bacterium]|nr:phospholipase D-like domain-containing protein [Anaerolineales bacterium]